MRVRSLVPYAEIWDEEGIQDELVEGQNWRVQSALEKEEMEEEVFSSVLAHLGRLARMI